MKIQRVETAYLKPNVLVRVRTDTGIDGIGECSPMNGPIVLAHLRSSLIPICLGRDPFDIQAIVEDMFTRTYKLAGQSQAMAASGIEIALWDVAGKALGVPVYKLLGGGYRKKIKMYASSMRRDISPDNEARRMKDLVDRYGFTAVKIRVGSRYGFDRDESPGRSEAVVREVRKALGDGVDIMVDANGCYTAPRAIQLGRVLERYNVFHFEEPCPFRDLESTAKVARALDMPVAGGEQDWDLFTFRQMLAMEAVDIVQPDPIKAGRLSVCKKIAALAEAHGAVCTPHQTHPLGTVATLHFVASTPNCRYTQELNIEPGPWRERMLASPLEVRDGCLDVPEGPGLGVELSPEALKLFTD